MNSPTSAAYVAEHVRKLHEPAFGRPHDLEDPDVTGDGTRVVVTGSVYDELIGSPRTVVYTVADGSLSAVTTGAGSARAARFSPDGETLAFASDRARAGVFQLFLLSGSGIGEAVAAPPVPGTIEYLHWSPDGRHVLVGVAGLGASLSGRQGSGANTVVTDDHPAWYPLVESGVPDSSWRSLWMYSVETGAVSQLSPEGVNCWEAGWCGPDAVLAVTSGAPGEDDWYHAVLSVVDVPSGTTRELLRSDVQLALPAGSPDGRYAAIVEAACSDRWVVAGDVSVIDLASGTRTAVDVGADVTRVHWLDGNRFGYLGQRGLTSVAGIHDLDTGERTELFVTDLSCGKIYAEGAFTADGRVVVARNGYRVPTEIAIVAEHKDEVLASVAHPGTDYLLSVNGTAERVTWTAPDGLEIDGMLCTPPGPGPYPLIVNVHGGPISMLRNTWSLRYPYVPLLVSRGYAVLNPNPRGSGGYGQPFARHVVGDMGGADTHDHLAGIDALVARGIADPARIGLIGGSYGGFMSSWLVTQDQRFAAAVPIAPVTDWTSKAFTSNIGGWAKEFLDSDPEQPGTLMHTRSPVLHASKVRTPCLNVAGGKDRCTPPEQAREFHQALESHGVESVLVVYPQEGHGVRSFPAVTDFLARVVDWFERHMPATAH
jgi:dipeptidyl aminopeptidase/acylaminoacyl peptidase